MRFFLFAGRRLGRFAILLLVAVLLCPLFIWLLFLDSHPAVLIGGGIVAIPAAMLASVLALGMLFAGFRQSKQEGISRRDAPELWALWESVAGKSRAARTTIVLDDGLNAGVAEERTLLGLFGRRVLLFIGIPLMAVTDERALAAIFAHEEAHIRNRDTNGSLNLLELEKSFDLIFDYAPPGQSLSGSLLYVALGPLARPLHQEELRLSRSAELDADRHAAAERSADGIARALILVEAANSLFDTAVHGPLQRELLGAMAPPTPPLLDRLLAGAETLSQEATLQDHASRAWERPDDADDDHPPLAVRLAALGYESIPAIQPISASAFSTLLSKEMAAGQVARFNNRWTSMIENYLDR